MSKINVPALKSKQQFTVQVWYLITAGWSGFWGCYSCVKTKNRDELVLKYQPAFSVMCTQMLSTLAWCLEDMWLEYLLHCIACCELTLVIWSPLTEFFWLGGFVQCEQSLVMGSWSCWRLRPQWPLLGYGQRKLEDKGGASLARGDNLRDKKEFLACLKVMKEPNDRQGERRPKIIIAPRGARVALM